MRYHAAISCSHVIVNHSSTSATAPAPRALLIATLVASVGFGLLAMTICLPSMPAWAGIFSVDQASVQLTFSAFVLAYGGAQVVYGPLSDSHGRRRLLLFGFALAALGSLLGAFALNLPMLIAARLLQGAGAAAGMVIGRAMVQDYFTGADRPRIMAYIGMAMGLCPPLATVVGGQFHVHFGWRANFVLMVILALVLLALSWRVVPATGRVTPVQAHWLREMGTAYRTLAGVPIFLGYALILSMCTGAFYTFLTGAPLVLARYGIGPGEVGWFIMVVPLSYIAGNFLTSRLLRSHPEARLTLIGQFVSCSGILLALLLAVAGVQSPFAFSAPLTLLGLGHGLLIPSTLTGTITIVPALAGTAAAAVGLSQQFVGALAAWLVGYLTHDSAANVTLLMLVFMLVSLLAQLLVSRAQARSPYPPP